jgi:hypothetical protein
MSDARPASEDQDRRFLKVCRLLNEADARYVICGGYACILHGNLRATQDVDILIEDDLTNFEKVLAALSQLEDGAARELTLRDLQENKVVKVADEITVDISTLAWVVTYAEAAPNIIWEEIDGVRIPFLSLSDLIRSKQTYRDKDRLDIQMLAQVSDDARRLAENALAPKRGCLAWLWR